MAIDQQAYGTFKFNKGNYWKVASELKKRINDYHDFSFVVAEGIYEFLKFNKIKKSKAHLHMNSDLNHNRFVLAAISRGGYSNTDFAINEDMTDLICDEIYRSEKNEDSIMKPRKAAFDKMKARSKTFSVEFPKACISIIASQEDSTIKWEIERCNHAVDKAERSFHKNMLFPLLTAHDWTDREGGYIEVMTEGDDEDDTSYMLVLGGIGSRMQDYQDKLVKARINAAMGSEMVA